MMTLTHSANCILAKKLLMLNLQFFLKKNGPIPASFSVYFRLFNMLQFKFKFKLKKAQMVCLGFKPGAAGWKVQMNPLSYGGTPLQSFFQILILALGIFAPFEQKIVLPLRVIFLLFNIKPYLYIFSPLLHPILSFSSNTSRSRIRTIDLSMYWIGYTDLFRPPVALTS